jgi:tRNA(Arg) A34 adenosine deaminase TadA
MSDDEYMELALRHAHEAFKRGDWPVGSVIVRDGAVLGSGQNRQVTERDVTSHAELDAIRAAVKAHGAERVAGATLFSTMEPCPMCAWALRLAGIRRLVLGTRHATLKRTDMGGYRVESFCQLVGFPLELTTGVREEECTALRRRWGKDQVTPA